MPQGRTSPVTGEQVISLGGPPWRETINRSTITIRDPLLRSAVALDPMGYPASQVPCASAEGAVTFAMPKECFHVIVSDRR
jgi:hypothetical protein